MVKTTVYLTDGLKRRVERAAEDQGRSEADVIRTALEQYVEAHAPRPTLPLFASSELPVFEDWDEAMRGFGEN